MNKVTLLINGQEVKAKSGMTVLEAAQGARIYIPTLCYHPALSPYGGCRLCIVEIEGLRGLPTACTTPASDGMVVRTDTGQLQELRRSIMEFILSEHPSACLTCDRRERCKPFDICLRNVAVTERCVLCPRNGRCELQRVADYIGIKGNTFPYSYKGLPIKKDDPLFDRDYNLCILCGRCVRICQEVRGASAIAFTYRGSNALVGTAFDRPLVDSGCRFCLACVEVCPTGALVDKEIKWETASDREAVLVPCKHACPAHINIPRYVRYVAEGMYCEALAVIREKVPFPGSLGRVCVHPCEQACRRDAINAPIAIKELKQVAADLGDEQWRLGSKVAKSSGKRVAVVGAGPAGLTAAFYLAKAGHSVTVFEALPEPGGMMRVGIPEYRLPRDILAAEIDIIRETGVEIRTDIRIESLDSLMEQGFNAILVATGAHQGTKIGCEGEDLPGVMDGATFLRRVNLGQKVEIGDRVAIIGGGNAAIDAARVALRVGAREVTVIYRRTRAEMPAAPEEVQDALEEGVQIAFLAAPSRISRNNGRLQLECIRMKLGEPDASGRRQPVPIKGSEYAAEYDSVIAAIGQVPEVPGPFSIKVGRGNRIQVGPEGLETSKQGVFAAGDAVSGAASVIEAIAGGRQAASAIDRYLGGSGIIDEVLAPVEEDSPCLGQDREFARRERIEGYLIPLEERLKGFVEAKEYLAPEQARSEAGRCLRCDLRLKIPQPILPPTDRGQPVPARP